MKKILDLKKRSGVLFIFFFIFCFLNLFEVQAATVRINPTKIRLTIPPGESKSGVIEVENPGDDALIVKAYLQDWAYSSSQNGSKEFMPSGSTPLSCSNWVSIYFSDFVIPGKGKQTLNYTVKVPVGAQGGHYAVLFFESLLSKPSLKDSAELGVVIRMGALFYIEPEGTIKRSAEISNPVLEKDLQDKSLKISLDLKNTGNTDITASGTFHIMDKKGMILARSEFNDVFTFPGDKAKFEASWKEALPKGKYDLIFTIDIGKALEELSLGRGPVITKEAEIEIGDKGAVLKVGELK